tara:strand:+ start:149 stop:754 length:606 start_codon:yes stop_codon:yes gene_type:complete
MLIENKYYFTHIPRTGGRYIESLFLKNNYVCNFNNYDLFLRDFLKRKNIEVAHFEYPYYLTLTNKKNLEKFTVVRDPVDRFRSCLRVSLSRKQILLNEKNINFVMDNLDEFINNQINSEPNNWFLPQINFLSHDTKIWMYENGLDKKFIDWLHDNFGFKFNNFNLDYIKADYEKTETIEFTPLQIKDIKNYYYKDYKIIYG